MLIPDPYIRKAYLQALANIGVPIFDMMVPKNAPIPETRILLSSQTKQQHNTNKCGHNWTCTILLDIINEQMQGYVNRAAVEEIEQEINNVMDLQSGDLDISPFVVLNTQVLDSHDIILQTQTTTVTRKLVRIQHILQGIY